MLQATAIELEQVADASVQEGAAVNEIAKPKRIEFVSLTGAFHDKRNDATIRVCIDDEDAVLQNDVAISTGPLDAIAAALKTRINFDFLACESKTVGRGDTAVDDVTIDIVIAGVMYSGRARMQSILAARACAFIAALNQSRLADPAHIFFKGHRPVTKEVQGKTVCVGNLYAEDSGTRGGTRRELVYFDVTFEGSKPVVTYAGEPRGKEKKDLAKEINATSKFAQVAAMNVHGDRCELYIHRHERFAAPIVSNVYKQSNVAAAEDKNDCQLN